MICTARKSSYLVLALSLSALCVLVVTGCWDSDEEETASNEPTYVNEATPTEETAPIDQVAHSGKATPAGEGASPNTLEHASEATPADDAAPPNRTELGFRFYSPKRDVPAPLRLRIFEASAIVRASLMSSSAEAVSYSKAYGGLDLDGDELTSFNEITNKIGLGDSLGPVDGEYRAAHTFRFRVSEYLKGSGASEITVTARTFSTHGTEAGALQVARDWLRERDTSRDSHEAIVFLGKSVSDDAFHFLRSGPYHSLHYMVDTMNRVWLPAKDPPAAEGELSSSDDSSLLFFTGDPSDPSPSTMSLGELRSEIAAVDALIEAGEGTEGYRECLGVMWQQEHWFAGWTGGEPFVPYESTRQLASGFTEGTEVYDVSGFRGYSGPRYGRMVIEGVDKDLFMSSIVDDDDRPDNGYKPAVVTVRPLPAGTYRFRNYLQHHTQVPCNFISEYHTIENVVVTAPAGTLHELFFDPVTAGSTVSTDSTNGVLKPASFTYANGASATLGSISYESGTVKVEVAPNDGLAGHVLDFIELDGTVSLSLDVDDATVDSVNDTLSWTVESQPWEDSDKLMVRIHGLRTLCSNERVVPNAIGNPGLVSDCIALLTAKDALRGTATLNWARGHSHRVLERGVGRRHAGQGDEAGPERARAGREHPAGAGQPDQLAYPLARQQPADGRDSVSGGQPCQSPIPVPPQEPADGYDSA